MLFRDPKNLLILVGLICQGFSWEITPVPLMLIIIWFLGLKIGKQSQQLSPEIEALIILCAFLAIKLVSSQIGLGYNKLIFLGGNVLLTYQLLRLICKSDNRQKHLSVLVAVMHIGIGTQVIFDFKIFIILITSVILIPKSLHQIESEGFGNGKIHPIPKLKKQLSIVFLLSIVFFLLFPRFGVKSRGTSQLIGGQGQGPLSKELDMSGSAGASTDRLIFRIEGDKIGYLKCFAMDKFDGVKWTSSHWHKKMARQWRTPSETSSNYRSVKISNYKLLNSYLPTDGFVEKVEGNYFNRPFISGDDGVKVSFPLRQNISYVYWSLPENKNQKLSDKESQRNLATPEISQRVLDWLNGVVNENDNKITQARNLAGYFQSKFAYKLGAPDLDRINPLEEFIFEKQEGHCERFASAVAVLLRAKGIPARVAVGYIAVEKNELGKFYNIRAKHAHAWTEAYFEDMGWTIVDGTPFGRGIETESKTLAPTFFEWIEFVWYSKIIEFGVHEQRAFFSFLSTVLKPNFKSLGNAIKTVFTFVLLVSFIVLALNLKWKTFFNKLVKPKQKRLNYDLQTVKHFYGQMQRVLAKENIYRKKHQTPNDFLRTLVVNNHPFIDDIEFITRSFCSVRYGESRLTEDIKEKISTAIDRLRQKRRISNQ